MFQNPEVEIGVAWAPDAKGTLKKVYLIQSGNSRCWTRLNKKTGEYTPVFCFQPTKAEELARKVAAGHARGETKYALGKGIKHYTDLGPHSPYFGESQRAEPKAKPRVASTARSSAPARGAGSEIAALRRELAALQAEDELTALKREIAALRKGKVANKSWRKTKKMVKGKFSVKSLASKGSGPMGGYSKKERTRLASSDFVFPRTRRWPIGDKAHAYWALEYMVAGRGKKSEYDTIEKAVFARWSPSQNPQLAAWWMKHRSAVVKKWGLNPTIPSSLRRGKMRRAGVRVRKAANPRRRR